jgi:DNA-binding NarL/FixJ family response regulator
MTLKEEVQSKLPNSFYVGGQQIDDLVRTLNRNQLQTFILIAMGLTNKAVAEVLNTHLRTIDSRREVIMKRLKVRSRIGLVHMAIKNNLITAGENFIEI